MSTLTRWWVWTAVTSKFELCKAQMHMVFAHSVKNLNSAHKDVIDDAVCFGFFSCPIANDIIILCKHDTVIAWLFVVERHAYESYLWAKKLVTIINRHNMYLLFIKHAEYLYLILREVKYKQYLLQNRRGNVDDPSDRWWYNCY